MIRLMRSTGFFGHRKARRERVLRKMATMRAAKDRKREQRAQAGLIEQEPRMVRWNRFEYGVRDRLSGETHWRELVSARQAAKALGLILKYLGRDA